MNPISEFEALELDRRLQLGLSAMDLKEPTEVQREVIPAALEGRDLRVSAETGSGKTLAYLIPLVQRILGTSSNPQAGTLGLILVPTRELARQVLKHCRKLTAKCPVDVQAITGGADFKYQTSIFRKNPAIIIATPGRLLEHCEKRSADLSCLETLILDEADRMLDMGFREDVLKINGFCAAQKQVLMLSATLKHKGVGDIAKALLNAPKKIRIGQIRAPHSSIFHQIILADSATHKDKLLTALLQNGDYKRVLVFASKRATAKRLAGLLSYHKLRCACLHGEMSTEERKEVVIQFSDGKVNVVCASDLAARGLDVKDISLVVNYDMPNSGDDYLHRTGRTGRAGAQGLAISLVGSTEWNLMISIERYLKLDFERHTLPGLKAKFNGPKKQKASGKATGSKKKRSKTREEKSKSRKRNQKNLGKPHKAQNDKESSGNDGFSPLKRKN
ncbi:MAG: DEAD/DEAH box helicase [Halieaceae bacterium]|jgi:ATP-dependent RNA helicase SrmB|nr:DEAD/DEAH box helicase [Halieaceae bacterium]